MILSPPIMCSSSSPTLTTSQSSLWTMSSRSSSVSTTSQPDDSQDPFTQLTPEPEHTKENSQVSSISDCSSLINNYTPSSKLYVRSATRLVPPILSSSASCQNTQTHTTSQQPPSIDSSRCLSIIQSLQLPFLGTLVSRVVLIHFPPTNV